VEDKSIRVVQWNGPQQLLEGQAVRLDAQSR
jgi:hypothetical protein